MSSLLVFGAVRNVFNTSNRWVSAGPVETAPRRHAFRQAARDRLQVRVGRAPCSAFQRLANTLQYSCIQIQKLLTKCRSDGRGGVRAGGWNIAILGPIHDAPVGCRCNTHGAAALPIVLRLDQVLLRASRAPCHCRFVPVCRVLVHAAVLNSLATTSLPLLHLSPCLPSRCAAHSAPLQPEKQLSVRLGIASRALRRRRAVPERSSQSRSRGATVYRPANACAGPALRSKSQQR